MTEKITEEMISDVIENHRVNLEDEAAKWLTEKLHSGEDNTNEYPVAAERALFVRGALDTLAGNVDYVLSQAVVEYFHGSTFAAEVKKAIKAEAVKRFPNKNAFPERFPDIKGKLIENKEV